MPYKIIKAYFKKNMRVNKQRHEWCEDPLRVAEDDGMRLGRKDTLQAEGFICVSHALYGDISLRAGSCK
jgi:hypothetical protein